MKVALTIVVCLTMLAAGFAQTAQTITLSESNTQLKDIFKEIRRQAGYEFVVDSKTLATATPVTINVKNATLEEVLTICFKGQPMTYTITGNTIVVKPIEKAEAKIEPSTSGSLHYVSGRVVDNKGGAIPGVNILIRGTSEGTVSDADGKYSLQVTGSDLLLFSFIGFKKFETEVGERTIIDVTLEEESAALNEVVINAGYYNVKEREATGNIAKVEAKDIERQPVTSPMMALQGRMAGVDIAPANGVPGTFTNVVVRGRNSISTSSVRPLYIIDGVPVDSGGLPSESGAVNQASGSLMDTGNSGFDPLSTISPANIESIEVLKDADATSIYGSRGANGVILVRTKRGEQSEKTNVDISFYSGVSKTPHFMDLLTTPQYVAIRKEALANDNLPITATDLVVWDTTRYTNWQKVLLGGSAPVNDLQLNVSGGSGTTTFRIGGNYHKEGMVQPGNFNTQRIAGNLNFNHGGPGQKFRMNVSLNYGVVISDLFASSNVVEAAIHLPPNAPSLYDANGKLNWENNTFNNPLSFLNQTDNTQISNLIANSSFTYKLSHGISAKLSLGYNTQDKNSTTKYPFSAMQPWLITQFTTASSSFGTNKRTGWIAEPQLSYDYKHNRYEINALIGSTWQENSSKDQLILASGYTSDILLSSLKGATKISYGSDDNSDYRYMAFFGRLGYKFKDRYLLNLTGRRDGSSRFGPDHRWGNFGAVGAAWIFSNEGFMTRFSFLSFGKVRGSYGITGSDQVGDYKYKSTYVYVPLGYQDKVSLYPSGLTNSNYAWEQTSKLEIAVELGFFNDRINIQGSQYINRCSNQLLPYQLPAITGFDGVIQNLNATVENSGVEILVNTVNINHNSFQWKSMLNFTLPKNKLISYPGLEQSADATKYVIGQPLNVARLYNYIGVSTQTGVYDVVDVNKDGKFDYSDRTYLANVGRKYYGGLNNTFSYKGIELSVFFRYSQQTSQNFIFEIPGGLPANSRQEIVLNHWREDGDVEKYGKASTNYSSQDAMGISYAERAGYANNSNATISNSSFIRLQTLSLSYTLQGSQFKGAWFTMARIYMQGQNLLTFSNAITLDPEVGLYSLPPMRSFTVGVEIKL
jgi:TonB-linked SusC/RagA family outer membrane protein